MQYWVFHTLTWQLKRGIKCRKRGVLMLNVDFVLVIRILAAALILHSLPELNMLNNRKRACRNALHCAKYVRIPPNSEAMISFTCIRSLLRLTERSSEVYTKHQAADCDSFADVQPDVPFLIKIANFSNSYMALNKNMHLCEVIPTAFGDKILDITFEVSEKTQ